jgi:DNA helicase-2/ATP-dependent DNA helicase PcrA
MKRFKDYKLYVLDKNYRSTQNILDASNKLIKNNSNRIDKSLNSDNGNGESVFIYEADSNDEESNFVAKQIIELSSKYKYSDIAILYRNNYLSRNIEAALMSHGINYVIYGGVKFYQRKEIKDLLAYLKIMVNDDEFSYKRIINIPKRNIGIATIDNISVYALNHNIPFVNALYLTNTNEFNLT